MQVVSYIDPFQKINVVENNIANPDSKKPTNDINADESEISDDDSDYNPDKDNKTSTDSDSNSYENEKLPDIKNKERSDEHRNGELIDVFKNIGSIVSRGIIYLFFIKF